MTINNYSTNKKGNPIMKVLLIILLALLLIAGIIFAMSLFYRQGVSAEEKGEVDSSEISIGVTEIVGHSMITIDKENPSVILENLQSNETLLTYEITDEDGYYLYESDYLFPGDSEEAEILPLFANGKYTLTYHISIYDKDYELLNSDIQLLQEIEVIEEDE